MPSYPPRHAPPGKDGPRSVKMPASRFSVLPTLRGFEVIDHDGSPVDELPTQSGAEAVRDDLNEAAAAGGGALARNLVMLHNHDDELTYYGEDF